MPTDFFAVQDRILIAPVETYQLRYLPPNNLQQSFTELHLPIFLQNTPSVEILCVSGQFDPFGFICKKVFQPILEIRKIPFEWDIGFAGHKQIGICFHVRHVWYKEGRATGDYVAISAVYLPKAERRYGDLTMP